MLNKQSVINLIASIKRKLETSSCQVRQCFCVQDLFTTDMWIMLIIWKVHNRTKLRSSAICIQHMHDDRYYHPDEAIWGFVWLGGWSLSLTRGYVFVEPFLLMNSSDLSEQEIVLLPKVGGGRCPVHKYSSLYFSVCSAKHLAAHTFPSRVFGFMCLLCMSPNWSLLPQLALPVYRIASRIMTNRRWRMRSDCRAQLSSRDLFSPPCRSSIISNTTLPAR